MAKGNAKWGVGAKMEARHEKADVKQGVKIGNILVVVFLVIYIPSFIHWVFGRTIATGIIQSGKLEESINIDGIIVRDETVLKSPFEGAFIPSVGEGEKIPVDFCVATVLKESSEKLINELKQKDLAIIKTQQDMNDMKEFFSEDLNKLEDEISLRLKTVIEESNRNSLERTSQLKLEIDKLIQKKMSILGETSDSNSYLSSLTKEKLELQKRIKQNTSEIVAPSSGIISYIIDGYESILRPDAITEFTPEYLEGIKVQYIENNIDNRKVVAEKPFAKVIKGIESYIVVCLDEDRAEKFKPGNKVKLRINDIGKTLDGKVYYMSSKINGKFVMAVEFNRGISETAGLRRVNVDLITRLYEGYKVPLSSLKDINLGEMTAKIMLVKAKYADERIVKIVGINDEFAIIESPDEKEIRDDMEESMEMDLRGVSLYDIFILRPLNIKEGQYINQ